MKLAITLAKLGRTSPNPRVGAVIVRDGHIVGQGFHPKAGEPHAEIFALREAGQLAAGATMYVTLEPCSHFGRTGPCAVAVIDAKIAEVYVGMVDPDPKVSGKGIQMLREAGVEVVCPICEDDCVSLNEGYIKQRKTGLPLVILKSAMSLDGRIATSTGDSKWITNERSRAFAHKIRANVDAIIVGANTARTDNPRLSARVGAETIYPLRVIVSGCGDIPTDLALFSEPGETIVAMSENSSVENRRKLESAGARILLLREQDGRISLKELISHLGEMGVLSVLIEGGAQMAGSALDERVVDKVVFFYAPKIIGGNGSISSIGGSGAMQVCEAKSIDRVKYHHFGDDLALEGYVKYCDDTC